MSGVVASVREAVDEVARGTGRFTRRAVVTGMLAVAALAPFGSAGAQQVANATGPVTVENAGRTAEALCRSRGDTSVDCLSRTRTELLRQISAQSRTQATNETQCSARLIELARDPAIRARGEVLLQGRRPSQYEGGLCSFVRALTAS